MWPRLILSAIALVIIAPVAAFLIADWRRRRRKKRALRDANAHLDGEADQ